MSNTSDGNGFPPYGGDRYTGTNPFQTPAPLSPFMTPGNPNTPGSTQAQQQVGRPLDHSSGEWTGKINPQTIEFLRAGRSDIMNQYIDGAPKDEKQRQVWEAARPTTELLDQFGKQYGVMDDPMFRDLANQFNATQQIYQQAGDKEGFQQYSAQFIQQVPQALSQIAQQKRQQEATQRMAAERFDRVMALQADFAPIFTAVADKTAASNQAMYEQSLISAERLAAADPRLAEAIKVNAAATRTSNDSLLAAYANQIAMTPSYVADMLYRETMNAQATGQPMAEQSQYQGLINAYQAATQGQ